MHIDQESYKINGVFVPITKIDEEKQEVWGVLAEEAPDREGEIFDYETSKPYFEKWTQGFQETTGGKSLGNLRAMHSLVAAGKFIDMDFRDKERQIYVGAKVVDADSWKKCREGVYTGFSIGAKVPKAWKDGDLRRYTADPVEGSLVDNPCMYGATFEVVKSAEASEMRKFRGPAQVWLCSRTDLHQHISKAEAIDCLKKIPRTDLEKGMYDVGALASCIATLNSIRLTAKWEAEYENDNSPLPAILATEVGHLIDVLLEMADEESRELLTDVVSPAKLTRSSLRKFLTSLPPAARNEATQVLMRASEQFAQEVEMKPEELEKAMEGALAKASVAQSELLKGALAEGLAAIQKSVNEGKVATEAKVKELEENLGTLTEVIGKIVLPTDIVAKAVPVSKEQDGAEKSDKADKLPEKEGEHDPRLALKKVTAAMRKPFYLVPETRAPRA